MTPRDDIKRLQTRATQALKQSKMDDAVRAAEEWLSAERRYCSESVKVVEILNFLGKMYWTMGDSDSAVIYFKQAVDMIQKVQPNSTTMAKTLTNMGFIYRQHDRNSQALRLLEESLSILEKSDADSMNLANGYSNVAMVLREMGRVKEGIRREKQAALIKEKIARGSESLAASYLSLGRMYLHDSVANPEKAIHYLELVQSIAPTLVNNDSLKWDVTTSLNEALSMKLQKTKNPKSTKVGVASVRPKRLTPGNRLISI